MSEKELFLQSLEQEYQTTLKVLKAYPAEKMSLKPHEKAKSAIELAWVFPQNEKLLIAGCATGKFEITGFRDPPKTMKEVIGSYEKSHQETIETVTKMDDSRLNEPVKFMIAPKQMGDVRVGDVLWMALRDGIHHRGQFSVYLRMAGGKVPSIYGPTADEPWS